MFPDPAAANIPSCLSVNFLWNLLGVNVGGFGMLSKSDVGNVGNVGNVFLIAAPRTVKSQRGHYFTFMCNSDRL